MSLTSRPDAVGPPAGLRVGGYQLLTRLGEGGMGVVHLARSPRGDRVALKVIRPNVVGDDESRARLAREVNSLSRVRSRRVAEILDADPWGPVPYVATRYVPGLSLHDHVAEEGPLDEADLTWFARCLAEALDAVHRAGVLHRDVKPSNVLMEGRSPVLIDFGLARVTDDPRLTAQGWLLGTPGYLAPEILYGEDASAAADIHSWAATVAYAGTGRAPFGSGPSMAVMDRVRRGEHDLSGLPEEIGEVVLAALDPDPRNRPTMAALHAWLDLDGEPLDVDAPTTPVHLHDVSATAVRPAVPDLDEGWEPAPAWQPETEWEPVPETRPYEDEPVDLGWWEPEPATRVIPLDGQRPPGRDGELGEGAWQPEVLEEPPVRAGFWERTRRTVLTLVLGVGVAAAVALAPYVGLVTLLVLVWLLRSGSAGAAAARMRRDARGTRWYDGVQTLLATPYHLTTSLVGTVALALWAGGLGVVAALLCFALRADVPVSLVVTAGAVVTGLWIGPGAGRVRAPLRRALVRPLASRGWVWLLVTVLLVGGVGLLGAVVAQGDTTWTPATQAPWEQTWSLW